MTSGPLPLTSVIARRASVRDVPALFRLVNHWADQQQMLPRSLNDLFRTVREFWVAEENGEVIACGGLRIYTAELAELCSLAVHPAHQGRGLGPVLVRACLGEARQLGLQRVFALTYQVPFFERLGFRVIEKGQLPEKVWRECVHCPFQDCCNETALITDLDTR